MKRNLKDLVRAHEKMLLEQTFARNGQNKDATAKALGISRRTLDKKFLLHRIGTSRFAHRLPIGPQIIKD